jgi:hypothetical protein
MDVVGPNQAQLVVMSILPKTVTHLHIYSPTNSEKKIYSMSFL